MSALVLTTRAAGLREAAQNLDHDTLLNAISPILLSKWFWLVQFLVVIGAVTLGWSLARTTDNARDAPQLPRHFSPCSSPAHDYGSLATNTENRVHDAAQVVALQAQVRAGKNVIAALEAKTITLSAALKRAEADTVQVVALRAEARNSESIILSQDAKLDAFREQARLSEQIISSAQARATQLSTALEKAETDAARLSALWADARGSDAIIISLDSKLEALRAQTRSKDETISSLESRLVSISAALERAERVSGARGPQPTREPSSHGASGKCDRCTPPVHLSTGKARGKWLRRQAEVLNDEAGKILFDAHNPELVGPRARLRNEIRIDLHLQFRAAAVEYVKNYATSARDQGLDKVMFIVGRGLHSEDNVPKLRPLVLETLKSLGMEARSPQNNPGEIVVKVQKRVD